MKETSYFEERRRTVARVADAFLRQNFGGSSQPVKVLMDHDLVVLRVDRLLSPAEIKLGRERGDTGQLHEMYTKLFERVKSSLVAEIQQITRKEVISSQIHLNFECGLCVMDFFLSPRSATEHEWTETGRLKASGNNYPE